MKIGLIDVDSHNFPNLPLMKLSAWHKAKGDAVEGYDALNAILQPYDKVYISKIFDFTPDYIYPIFVNDVICGGTGYDLFSTLPDDVEHIYPDYSLYNVANTAYGFLTRGCPRSCGFCIVTQKEGQKSIKVADLSEFWQGQRYVKLLDPNLLACPDYEELLKQLADSKARIDFTQGIDARLLDKENIELLNKVNVEIIHFSWDDPYDTVTPEKLKLFAEHSMIRSSRRRSVYILTNYNSTHDQDLCRIYEVRRLGYDPYVMIYDKQHAPRQTRLLQRWVNNKIIFKSCSRFEDYDPAKG